MYLLTCNLGCDSDLIIWPAVTSRWCLVAPQWKSCVPLMYNIFDANTVIIVFYNCVLMHAQCISYSIFEWCCVLCYISLRNIFVFLVFFTDNVCQCLCCNRLCDLLSFKKVMDTRYFVACKRCRWYNACMLRLCACTEIVFTYLSDVFCSRSLSLNESHNFCL